MEDRAQGDHEVPLRERVPGGGGHEGDLLIEDSNRAARRSRWGYAIAPSDGTSLFYELEQGDGGVPVALLDGIGCDGYAWRHIRRGLGSRTVVHGHYRGHGRTSAPRDPARVAIPDLADDLITILDDAGIAKAVLIGHSMGVQVALETFRRHKDRVAGLVLANGAASHPLRTFRGTATLERLLPEVRKWLGRAPGAVNRVLRAVVPTKLSFELAKRLEINGALVDPADFMPYLEGIARIDSAMFGAMLHAAGMHSAEDMLATIDVPTLVIAGGRDGFTPPERSRDMAACIPQAGLLWIEDGSHTTPIERPQEINEGVIELLAQIDQPSSPIPDPAHAAAD